MTDRPADARILAMAEGAEQRRETQAVPDDLHEVRAPGKAPSWSATPKRPDEDQTGYAIRQIREHTAWLVLSDLRERLTAYDESCSDKKCDCCSAWRAHIGTAIFYIDGELPHPSDNNGSTA